MGNWVDRVFGGDCKEQLKEVFGRLSGEAPDSTPIIKLETSLGDGKTHNLIALYYIAKAGKGMNGFIVKHTSLYLNNMDTKIVLWLRHYTRFSRLFLCLLVQQLLAFSLRNIGDIL
ncbi:MAG: hypothetical protein JRN32_01440 [Nitrososphaerota archaeon]|jgi:hypothetical protein|nr:hypothetical protein [Nitrososphaerota archaeon]MDG7036138.1 hypothetical protein [Nitrososphaerota archaeon]MDG7037796.1 hypothetical protein [Nitrososphaerota archaeon]MDG7045464.1 hypothetical protein [Nitrososphaerota archaeon]